MIRINTVKTLDIIMRTEYINSRQIRLTQFICELFRDYTGNHTLATAYYPLKGLTSRIAPHEAPFLLTSGIRGNTVNYPPTIPAGVLYYDCYLQYAPGRNL